MAPDSDLAGVYPAGELAPTGNAPICARTNAISHLKIVMMDGVYTVRGSTNWSLSSEQQQDDELTLSRNAVVTAETRAILDLNHDFMLKQMVGTKLDVTKLLAATTKEAMPPLPAHPATLDIPHRIAVVPVPGCGHDHSRGGVRPGQATHG